MQRQPHSRRATRWPVLLLLVGSTRVLAQPTAEALRSAHAHLQAGRLHDAERAFARVVRLDSTSVDAWNGWGATLTRLERYTEALRAADRAARLAPERFGVRFNRGLVLVELGRFREALAEFNEVLRRRPGFAPALTERGAALAALGDRDAALASWTQAGAADSSYIWWRYYRALQAVADGQYDAAVADLDTVVASNPEHAVAQLWRLVAYRRGGRAAPQLPMSRDAWPGPIAAFLEGRITASALDSIARHERHPLDDRRLASARFFIAQQLLAQGETTAATRTLDRVIALPVPAHAEVVAAAAERRRLRVRAGAASMPSNAELRRLLFDFLAPLSGLVRVEIVDRDAAGREEYRAVQTREFSPAVGATYVREVLLDEVVPRREGGMILHGVSGSRLQTFNFWGAEADGAFVTWTADGPHRWRGVGEERVNGERVPMRAELSWEGDALTWRTWVTPAGAAEYLDHTLTYRAVRP